jgi:hypothetical protein
MNTSVEAPRMSMPYLFLGSVAALFLEMTLIRWVSTEVRVFAYVQNLALIACFLGFGLGCYYADRQIRFRLGTISTVAIVVMITYPSVPWQNFLFIMSELLTLSPDSAMWSLVDPTGKSLGVYIPLAVAVVTVFLSLLIGAMFPLGQYVGKALDDSKRPIAAYTVNLAGSFAGGWLLAGLSFMQTKPHVWLALSFLMIFALRQPRRIPLTLGALVAVIAATSLVHPTIWQNVAWSPYQ